MAAYNDTCGPRISRRTGNEKSQARPNMKLQKRSNSGNDQRHKGSLGRKNPENDENFQRKTTKTTRKHLPTGKHRKITWINGVPDGKQRGSFKNLTIKGIA
ncbi:hypothetical protein EVAR_16190_1 [Eumeta japonica]|uniref:Uncharacterized protein n=1 Tax=Eumeta variegata TaxID=151549 RepID=A0A4C1WBT5_EUMVA|nr:hypothetical protein EVAR_16190_1 [Eumeta japonica]